VLSAFAQCGADHRHGDVSIALTFVTAPSLGHGCASRVDRGRDRPPIAELCAPNNPRLGG
jgi:hypothetical protein